VQRRVLLEPLPTPPPGGDEISRLALGPDEPRQTARARLPRVDEGAA
jgi:hypothetical protein